MGLVSPGWDHSWTQIVLKESSCGWHQVLAVWGVRLGLATLGGDFFLDGYRKREGESVPKVLSIWAIAAGGELPAQH